MRAFRPLLVCLLSAFPALSATFGTAVSHTAGKLGDLAYDAGRQQLYVLSPLTNTVDVYSTRALTTRSTPTRSIQVDTDPIALAMSRDGNTLYVACYTNGLLDIIDLRTLTKVGTPISLPANPQALAVGVDGKLLISTNGNAQGQFVLTLYDPNATVTSGLTSVTLAAGAIGTPSAPTVPPPNGLPHLAVRAHLVATPDGQTIIGVHEPANNTRSIFVYQVSSATVLRSRTVPTSTAVLAVSADGSRFVSGHILFDTATLAVLAQQNTTNSPFVFTGGANFTTLASQGGAVFLPSGSQLLTAYNIVPLANPTAQSNTAQILVNTPDNLLIQLGIQLPENLGGKMVITPDGATIYALSTSGFTVLPISTLTPGSATSAPIAMPDSNVALLASDQCGVFASQNRATIPVRNVGGGRITVSAQVLTTTTTSTSVSTASKTYGGDVTASFNAAVPRTTLGTATPDQLLIQSPEAVNIIPTVRVFQNYRNSETPGTIMPVDIGATTTGLTDIVADTARQRLYLANPGLNRIEVFDMQQKVFMSPIVVGQLPRSIALGADGNSLYVANSGGENLSLVHLNTDLTKVTVETVKFPPLPFATTLGVITPMLVASSQRDPQIVMSDGSLWKVVGSTLTKRTLNPNIFGAATTIPGPQTMVSTPEGSYILLLSGQGAAYVYSASVDDIVAGSQVLSTPLTGYLGAVGAGPNGQYFLAGGQILNSALTLIGTEPGSTGTVSIPGLPIPGGPGAITISSARPVAALSAVGAQSFARFTTPLRANLTTPPTDAGIIELVDASTLKTTASITVPEGPLTTVVATGRATNIPGRQMVVDAASFTAYAVTASGLSILALNPAAPASPQLTSGGVVNTANFQGKVAAGGLIAIFGRNLGSSAGASAPLPTTLGGVCVTLTNTPIPLMATSSGQINAQLPPTLTAGNYSVVVRSLTGQAASNTLTVAVAKYAPAIFVDANGPAIYHANGNRVDKNHPANRDEELTILATGMGPTTGGRVTAGTPSPSSPLAVTGPVNLWFGDPTRSDTPVIVDWSGLAPGLIGVYQINCRVPGTHYSNGSNPIPVTLKVGGVSSPVTGANVPVVYVN